MTTKEYLQQIGKLNKMINNKMIELAQMKEMAYSIKAVGTDERVMSSSDPDKTGCAYAKIEEMEEKINGMIDDKYDILCVSLIPGAGKTTVEKMFNALVAGWYPKDFSLFYSHSGDITRMYFDGVYDIVTNSDEYTWSEIFPNLHVTSTNAKLEQFNIGKYKPFPSVQCTSVGSKNSGKVRSSNFIVYVFILHFYSV
jgi:hypothetical protein